MLWIALAISLAVTIGFALRFVSTVFIRTDEGDALNPKATDTPAWIATAGLVISIGLIGALMA